MYDFSFSVPQDIRVGRNSIEGLGDAAKKLGGTHAFIISGPHLKKIGLVDKCISILAATGIKADSFTDIEANPSVTTVEKAAAGFKAAGANLIIAAGGGSPMDVAKAVGIIARYGGSITEYEGGDKVPGPIIPQIAIPTTAGTGSEVTAFSVITDHTRNYKLTVFSYDLIPACAILDPTLITTVPFNVAAACGMDAFIHALEAYISTAASPFSEAMSEKAMELIGSSIRSYTANRTDMDASEKMLVGSLFAGIAFSWARLGNVHAMSHPVSAYFDVPHGEANAILLPAILEYNLLADKGKYKKIYEYVTGKRISRESFSPKLLPEAIRELNASLGIASGLASVGVTEDMLPLMAEDAMKSGNISVNPRSSVLADIISLYKMAM